MFTLASPASLTSEHVQCHEDVSVHTSFPILSLIESHVQDVAFRWMEHEKTDY